MSLITKADLELVVLKKVDPAMTEIVGRSSFVAVYSLSLDKLIWKKTDYEGMLLIYKKSETSYVMLVLNRLKEEHLFISISDIHAVQTNDYYLLFQTYNGMIYALWFPEKEAPFGINSILGKIANNPIVLNDVSKRIEETKSVVSANDKKVDLMTMLANAKKKYKDENIKQSNNKPNDDVQSTNVANFFANVGKTIDTNNIVPIPVVSNTIIKKLTLNPEYSLQNIEKQITKSTVR